MILSIPTPNFLPSLDILWLLCCSKRLGHSFYGVFVSTNVHAGNTRYFSNSSPQFLIAGCHNKTFPLRCHIRQTVIGISLLFAIAWNSLKPRILGQPKCNFVFPTQFFQFGHDAIRHARYALGQEAIHHGSDHVEFFAATKEKKEKQFGQIVSKFCIRIGRFRKRTCVIFGVLWTHRMLKLIKFVSTRTWYGGPSCSLYRKNKEALACSICRGSSFFFFANFLALASSMFFRTRVSLGDIIRLATANFLVCLAFPMVIDWSYVDCCRNWLLLVWLLVVLSKEVLVRAGLFSTEERLVLVRIEQKQGDFTEKHGIWGNRRLARWWWKCLRTSDGPSYSLQKNSPRFFGSYWLPVLLSRNDIQF